MLQIKVLFVLDIPFNIVWLAITHMFPTKTENPVGFGSLKAL